MNNYIDLEDRQVVPLQDLLKMTPLTIYSSNLHFEVCELLVVSRYPSMNEDKRKLYVNLLFLKSYKAKQITSLVVLVREGILKVKRVTSDFITNDFSSLLGHEIKINCYCEATNLIDYKHIITFFYKAILNNVYRLFSRKQSQHDNIIRTWVDVSETLYGDQFSNSIILIYPFTLNIRRHISFIRRCFSLYPDTMLAGIPYKFTKAIGLLWTNFNRDLKLVDAEYDAYVQHAKEFAELQLLNIFTSDEYEVASFLLYKALGQKGVFSTNSAHGVGLYCPHIYYNRFFVFNSAQRNFYIGRNPQIEYRQKQIIENKVQNPSVHCFHPMLIFIHTNPEKYGLVYEDKFQDSAIRQCAEIAERLEIPFTIKIHPNTTKNEKKLLVRKFGATIVDTFSELRDHNPIYINIISTAYYDLYEKGPVIFLKDELLNPHVFFGENISSVRIDELDQKIVSLLNLKSWTNSLAKQVEKQALSIDG